MNDNLAGSEWPPHPPFPTYKRICSMLYSWGVGKAVRPSKRNQDIHPITMWFWGPQQLHSPIDTLTESCEGSSYRSPWTWWPSSCGLCLSIYGLTSEQLYYCIIYKKKNPSLFTTYLVFMKNGALHHVWNLRFSRPHWQCLNTICYQTFWSIRKIAWIF